MGHKYRGKKGFQKWIWLKAIAFAVTGSLLRDMMRSEVTSKS